MNPVRDKMKKLLFIVFLFFIIDPISAQAATGPYNAGFVSGLWYSKVPFFAGEKIRIYTAFQNHSGGDITGAVQFFDNDTSIGKANFSAINDRLVETWIDWTVSYGNHAISAKIVEAQRSEAGKPAEKIEVLASESKPETIFADNTPLPSLPKAVQTPTEAVIQTVSNISSKVAESIVTAIDNFVPYSPLPSLVVPAVVPVTPVVPATVPVKSAVEKVNDTTTTATATPATQTNTTPPNLPLSGEAKASESVPPDKGESKGVVSVPASSGGGGGGGNNQSSSITEGILNTLNNYKSNLLQTVNVERQATKSNIKNIDEMYKKIDTDRDGLIGLTDFNVLMINWGKRGVNIADYNQDGIVDLVDFNILMIYWS